MLQIQNKKFQNEPYVHTRNELLSKKIQAINKPRGFGPTLWLHNLRALWAFDTELRKGFMRGPDKNTRPKKIPRIWR